MADRTVTVRLRLDSTQWAAGQNAAVRANDRMSASARAAATRAERDAQRTASAVAGTFSGMARSGEAALGRLDAAAARSSQTLARSNTAAAASTRQVGAAAAELPATFHAAGTAGTAALRQIDAAAAASTRAVTGVGAGMSAATAAAAAGTSQLSLASRLALAEAAQASRVAAASAATAERISTSAHLAASGATNAAVAAAAATARADANARALAATFGAAAARARTMGSAAAAAASRSERTLRGARTASLGLVAAFGIAVYASSRFETAMSGVKAATQASGKELDSLRQAAIQAGASTQYSATQAAGAEKELAKAGVSTADILGGALKGTLSLAAAGEMDVAESAIVAAKAMNSFGLSGSQMGHIADVIAAAAGKSATDVHQMSLAFAQSSLLAHQTGLSLEQAAGSLALFAQNGLVGSDAGTSLKTMLMRLTPQSEEARGVMEKLGFSAYDAQGNFVGLDEVANRMQQSFGGLSPEARNSAMSIIFGSDAIRAATIVTQAGAAGIDAWTKAANDQGYAARYAATQTDNLQGDVRRLASALETALISSGSAANGMLREMAQALTAVVRWYTDLPPGVQKSVTALAGFLGVVGLIGSGLLLMLPRIVRTQRALVELGLTAARTRTLMAGLGRLGMVAGVLAALTCGADKLTEALKKPAPNVTKLTDSLVDLVQSGKKTSEGVKELDGFGDAVARIAHPSTLNRLDDIASSVGHLGLTSSNIGSYTEATDQIKALDDALSNLVASGATDVAAKAFKIYAAEAEKSGTSTKKFKTLLPQYTDALTGAGTQQKLAADSQKEFAEQMELSADAIRDTATQTEKLTAALDALNGASIDTALSEIDFRNSVAAVADSVKDNGHSLDINTDKGRKNTEAILNAARAAQSHAEAVATQTESMKKGQAAYARDIELLRQDLKARGFNEEAVKKLITAYLQVPRSATTAVSAPGLEKTAAELDAVRKKLADVPAGKSITVKAPSAAAIAELKAIGYKVETLPNHQIKITVPTKAQKAALADLDAHIRAIRDRTIVLTIEQKVKTGKLSSQAGKNQIETIGREANGGIRHFAGGGMEQHVAQIARAGEWRVWAEDETGGEAYIPFAASKRHRSRAIAEETVRRLGGKGIAWNAVGAVRSYASGGLPTYTPTQAPALGGATDAMDRYNTARDRLKDAWETLAKTLSDAAKETTALHDAEANLRRVRSGHHTEAQLAAAEKKLRDARNASAKANASVTSAKSDVYRADAALGVAKGAKAPASFDLRAYQVQLGRSVAATETWRKSLDAIGKRGGSEIRSILEGMGEDGYALVQALAKASDKQFADIAAKLKATAGVAKAGLADFQRQVSGATKESAQFASDLQKLAAQGYGSLAQALAAQGDAAAQDLAHQAAGDSKAAAAADRAVKGSGQTLTGEELANALTLLSTLRGGRGRGFEDLIRAGLDVATIRALVPKMMKQISALPSAYKTEFLKEWGGQSGVTAMARGGLLTRPTAVLAAEAGVPEWFIPQNGSARSAALLSAAAAGMGYQLVPAGRWAGHTSAGGGTTHVDRSQEIHLHAANQSLGEQRADLLRHMEALG
ncbi:phage tail tape measure protein [Streptomyces sp.]|uniref:phage tail tape measure protein n=1 Tax=Streptomyces sp. TaxID=1931 RepID=UPI002F3EACCF